MLRKGEIKVTLNNSKWVCPISLILKDILDKKAEQLVELLKAFRHQNMWRSKKAPWQNKKYFSF